MPIAMVVLWLVAAGLALRFGLGNARVWRNLALGFLLLALAALLPAVFQRTSGPQSGYLLALGQILGIAAIMAISHSVLDYFTFTRTLDEQGGRVPVGLVVAVTAGGLLLLLLAGPEPTAAVRQGLRIVENGNWVFLTLINIGLLGKIRDKLGDMPVSRGFFALAAVFACIVLWKGSELYLDVYRIGTFDEQLPLPYRAVSLAALAGNGMSALGVSAVFIYLARLLR